MSSPFMSSGVLTESKMGLTVGPRYGGPGMLVPSGGAISTRETCCVLSWWRRVVANRPGSVKAPLSCLFYHRRPSKEKHQKVEDAEKNPVVEDQGPTNFESNESKRKYHDDDEGRKEHVS